jgi:hypothetical protein
VVWNYAMSSIFTWSPRSVPAAVPAAKPETLPLAPAALPR